MNWADLVDTAVIGTARRSAAVANELPGLDQVALDRSDDQTRLLDSAAVTSRIRRAGYRPPPATDRAAPAPAEPDERPEPGQAAQRRLGALLAAQSHDLVAEWLLLLAATPCRPPDALLPALLTLASGNRAVRATLVPVLGPLAGWLATFNADWSWAAGASLSTRLTQEQVAREFGTSSLVTRQHLLSGLRASDPAAARELLASTWASDPYRERATLLATLMTGLSLADEPLAELGLADRRAEVRQVAADLLARLPGSRYSIAATARAAAAVRVERRGVRQRLVVTVADDMAVDVAGDGAPPIGIAGRAGLLGRLAAAAPAAFWAGHTGLAPGELLALAARTEWAGPLRAGWTRAAIRDGDAEWLTALLDQVAARWGEPGVAVDLRLFSALPAEAQENWLCAQPRGPLFLAALELVPVPWSARVSGRARSVLAEVARADPGHSPAPRAALRLAALGLDPPVPPQLDPDQVHDRLAGGWHDLLLTLSARAAMRRELAEEPDQ